MLQQLRRVRVPLPVRGKSLPLGVPLFWFISVMVSIGRINLRDARSGSELRIAVASQVPRMVDRGGAGLFSSAMQSGLVDAVSKPMREGQVRSPVREQSGLPSASRQCATDSGVLWRAIVLLAIGTSN